MDDIQMFAKKETELGTQTQIIGIYSQDIGIEFGSEKCIMLNMKSGKRECSTKERVKTLR